MADQTGKDGGDKSGKETSGDTRPPWGRPVMDPTLINNGWTGKGDSRLPGEVQLPQDLDSLLKRRKSNDE